MAGRRQRVNPLDVALVRLADLAGRGVMPSRMAREVEVIVAGWLSAASPVEPDDVAERLAAMHEQLVTGASAAAEQVSDVDADDPAALRHAKLVHAALEAAVEAVERARDAQGRLPTEHVVKAPVPAPAAPRALAEAVALPSAETEAPDAAVTIDSLAERNPQGVDHSHPAKVRLSIAAEPISTEKKSRKVRTSGPKERTTRRSQAQDFPELLR